MSLNKFTNAEKSLPLGLEAGFKKIIVDELVFSGAQSSSKFRSSGEAVLTNNATPLSMFPAGFGSLTLPDGEFVEGTAYEASFRGTLQVVADSQALFILKLGDGSTVPCGSLQYKWLSGSGGIKSFKLDVKFVAFLDGGVLESVRCYMELLTEDGDVLYKGFDSPQFALPFDQIQDLDLTMEMNILVGASEFVVQCAELNRIR